MVPVYVAGSGKTVLWYVIFPLLSPVAVLMSTTSSAVIQRIMKLRDAGRATLAYHYFDFRDQNKDHLRNFVTSVLVQLSASSNPCRDVLYRLYSAYKNSTQQPSNAVFTGCLNEMVIDATGCPIFIVIDALDECLDTLGSSSPQQAILDVVKELGHMYPPNLRICVTSRPEIDLETKLAPLAVSVVSLHGQSGRTRDIANYVTSVVSSDENLKQWSDEDKKLVVEELSERADGM